MLHQPWLQKDVGYYMYDIPKIAYTASPLVNVRRGIIAETNSAVEDQVELPSTGAGRNAVHLKVALDHDPEILALSDFLSRSGSFLRHLTIQIHEGGNSFTRCLSLIPSLSTLELVCSHLRGLFALSCYEFLKHEKLLPALQTLLITGYSYHDSYTLFLAILCARPELTYEELNIRLSSVHDVAPPAPDRDIVASFEALAAQRRDIRIRTPNSVWPRYVQDLDVVGNLDEVFSHVVSRGL
ncbi:hypothetical protein C8R44DRAFT_977461 [Mycena epipterygia]|nr:hypothetical protein C8R44DRAFT_977461 [Mycena epipterygia]